MMKSINYPSSCKPSSKPIDMSSTITETQTQHTDKDSLLKPERSQLGLLRPDHSKNVFVSWLTTVDHKKIGIMYGALALLFLLIGGVEP